MSKVICAKYPFVRDGNAYVTDNPHPGKITGTAIGGILGVSPWETPFSIACRLLGLYNEDISDKPAVRAGQILEGSIIDYLRTQGYDTIPAEQLFKKREGEHQTWASDFEDPDFGGHVDGITAQGDIVEIKTTSNPESWIDGVPVYYHYQASLYAHFMGAKKIIFAVGVLSKDDVTNPYGWKPTPENTFVYEVEPVQTIVSDIAYLREWYTDYIRQGRTPEPDLDSEKDLTIIKALDAQMGDGADILRELEDIESRLDEYKGLKDRADELKGLIMLRLEHIGESSTDSASKTYTMTTYERTAVDTDAMKRDGIYDKYTKTTTTRTLRAKKRRY